MKNKLLSLAPYVLPSVIVALFVVAVSTSPAFAQTDRQFYDLRLGIYGGGFFGALARIINFVLLIGGIVAFLFVLYGGFLYLTAGGDAARAGSGRTVIVNAVIGIIIIFLSFAVVRFVVSRTQQPENQFQFSGLDIVRG